MFQQKTIVEKYVFAVAVQSIGLSHLYLFLLIDTPKIKEQKTFLMPLSHSNVELMAKQVIVNAKIYHSHL